MIPLLSKMAWEHPPTEVGYRRLAMRRTAWMVSLVALGMIATGCLALRWLPQALAVLASALVVIVPSLPVVLVAYVRRKRIAAILKAYPWCEVRGHHPPRTPSIIAIRIAEDCAPTFRMFPFPIQVTDSENLIWFAGDPRFGGVVSPVGGHRPVRVVLDKGAGREWGGGDDALALRVGLVRRSGKATQT
ncbi:hypothetical protein CG724_01985 [Streptomyces sp. CB02120-2]|nr:hypothetical protein A6A28_04755 [Streptomyces sp. CB03578]PJN20578.1 hypothetical protein CG724_01985 [Streptomyces sp. CB02120-2]